MKIAYRNNIKSFFHEIDPISKIVWYFFITIWLISLRDAFNVFMACLYIFIICFFLAKIELFRYLKHTAILMLAGSSIILFHAIFQPGQGFNIFILHFSYYGLSLGFALVLRTLGFVAAALAFTTTTRPKDFSISLQKLGLSYRFSHLIYLSLTLIPQFGVDLEDSLDALKLRGFKPGIQRFVKSAVTMLTTQLRRSEDISIALETRAFGLYKTKTIMGGKSFGSSGKMLILITGLVFALHLFLILTRKL